MVSAEVSGRRADPLAAALAVARSLGLPTGTPRVLSDRYTLVVHLAPAPVVARVPTGRAVVRGAVGPWLARELAVARWLAAAGAPVVPPTDAVAPARTVPGGIWCHCGVTSSTTPTRSC